MKELSYSQELYTICSVCGRASIKSLTESLYEYCPKCGARMDGDTNG